MSEGRCWGVFRELAHSPGRESDDAEILRLTAKHLEAKGFEVTLKAPEELAEPLEAPPGFVFLMCERLEALERLGALEAAGVLHVNTPGAVLNTYRERMIQRFEAEGVPFIPSRIVPTAGPLGRVPARCWVKRADVHNTQEGDVVFAPGAEAARAALAALARRGIPRAVLQDHVEGDLIKFYGIGGDTERPQRWFRWFYHRDQRLAGHRFDAEALAGLTRRAATALGLEIYGGDAIATGGGGLTLIDLNAWPSFALFREEAAAHIAVYLERRFRGAGR